MIDPEKALDLVRERSVPGEPRRCSLQSAAGCVLAEAVSADRDFPPFDRSMMDGVAVRVEDAGSRVRLTGEVAAGQPPQGSVEPGTCFTVMTGAACPPGTEAVVPKEKTTRDGEWVALPPALDRDWNVVRKGSERARGAGILEAGALLTPLAVAALAAAGCSRPLVIPRPTIALITTGREVVDPATRPETHQIRDANGPMLESQAAVLGAPVAFRTHADDTEESLLAALERAGEADIILFVGGVSMGKYDLVPGVIERFGAEIVFRKVSQKPGKPLLLAGKGSRLIFGIPGNPLAAHFCYHRYVSAAVLAMAGRSPERLSFQGVLSAPAAARKGRTSFLLGQASLIGGEWQVMPAGQKSTADLFGTVDANCYLRLEGEDGELAAGDRIAFTLIGGIEWSI